MIKKITKEEIKKLINVEPQTCVSIFMPTMKAGPEQRQKHVLFKNLIDKAVHQLVTAGVPLIEAEKLLFPAKQILKDESFWKDQSESLVVYQSNDLFAIYSLNFSVQEEVIVGKHFYIKPLLPLFIDSDFYLLVLSKNQIRMFNCNSFNYKEIKLKGVPKSLEEAIRFNDPERVLQFHTNTPRTPGARAAAIFHGHGVGIDDEKDDLLEYFRQIDRGLHPLLKDKKAPLILAAVDYFHPLYKKMNTYPYLFEIGLFGNMESLNDRELYIKAKNAIKSDLKKQMSHAVERFNELEGTHRVSKDIQTIMEGAKAGKISDLFLQSGSVWWGKINGEAAELISHDSAEPGDEEILNLAAIYTIRNRGNVILIEKDGSRPAAFALFRY